MTYVETSYVNEDPVQRYLRYKNDPWDFLTEAVRTKDEVDQKAPVKLFPNKDYLKIYVRLWQKYPLLLVPKARRMTMSWATIALYTWDAIFNDGRNTAFVSKKEDDAAELILRAKFIYDNLDPVKVPRELLPELKHKFNRIDIVERGSTIRGYPMGADQLRMHTFSGIFGDESAFWEDARAFYSATLPTIDGGGKMTLVSSPAPSFFKFLCFDMVDYEGVDFTVPEKIEFLTQPMTGVRVWKNRKNKFLVFELHYTADVSKRAPEYAASIKDSMPLTEYLREYELHWDTFAGFPVYPEFQKLHKIAEHIEPVLGIPLLVGLDFGLTPAAVIGQYVEGRLFIIREYIEINMGADRFMDKLSTDLKLRWPAWGDLKKDWRCFVDPSGFFRKDTDEGTCADIVRKYFAPVAGEVAWEARRKPVVEMLQKLTPEGPAFVISSFDCSMTVKGFEGGYMFPEKAAEIEPTKLRPLKNAYSHPHDALQYMIGGIKNIIETQRATVPKPSYTITKGLEHGGQIGGRSRDNSMYRRIQARGRTGSN